MKRKMCIVLCLIAGLRVAAWFASSFLARIGPASATEPKHAVGNSVGYGEAFAAELQKIGQITPDEFGRRFGGKTTYLARLDWDPTEAIFFDRFNIDPSQPGAKVQARGAEEKMLRKWADQQGQHLPDNEPVMVPIHGSFDFRLNNAELAKFKQNGFVVSERMSSSSCTDMFYRIYQRDLPVLITSDAVLHAWHRSYDAMLEEVEASMLIPALNSILAAMAGEIPKENVQYGNGLFKESVSDADYFIAVARSLLAGQAVKSELGNDDKVVRTVEKCHNQQMEEFKLFGSPRMTDFSQFKPRGHYEKSEQLKRYFRAMMWCGRIDMRVAGNPKESSARQLASALVLHDLLKKSGSYEQWSKFDRMIQTFVGQADSMTFAQLGSVLAAGGIQPPADVKGEQALAKLGERIGAGDFGAQEIRGDYLEADPSLPGKLALPRSFAFLGQRFVVDSWVMSKVVYDDGAK